MTILYKVQNAEYLKDNAFCNKCVLCKISVRNIVAFCVTQNSKSSRNIVLVRDVLTPWQNFQVCSSNESICVMEWNCTGELLLIGYANGIIEIWSTRQQLLSSWYLMYKASFRSEFLVDSKFFHNGKSVFFNSQKKDLVFYGEKFDKQEFRPTLTRFGNVPTEGCVVLSASGLLGVIVIPVNHNDNASNHPVEIIVSAQCMSLTRRYLMIHSMAYNPNGCINIAVCCSRQEQLVQCFKVSLKTEQEDNVKIKCESFPNVFIYSDERKKISALKWSVFNNENIILIAYDCADGSLLEQWCLTKKHQSVHNLLQKNKADVISCESWENVAKLHFESSINRICLSKLHSDYNQIFVIFEDATIQILEPGFKKVGFTKIDRLTDDRQTGRNFVAGDVTSTDQILLVFDNFAHMYAMQISNMHTDKALKLNTISLQISLLEYCIVTGVDANDILLLNITNLDILIEKLTENFMRQPPQTRHFYYSNFLSLKSHMCRIQSKQHDFDNLIILHSISITFKSLLRPSDLSYQDKGPAENLSIILSEPLIDVDKVLFNLDAKDFTVEPLTLQSLQQLIQWVSDLALHILYKLPEEVMKSKLNKKQGYDISRDVVAIGSIRELLVLIRIWGLLNSQCLPVYTKSVENFDVLSVLFRLLTRLAQNTSEPDELLLDECSMLPTQILIPKKNLNCPATLLSCHISVMKPYPILCAAVGPVAFQEIQFEEVVFTSPIKDGVTNLQLGSRVDLIRKCLRCGFVNSHQKQAKTAALKAWCNRWLYCHCGGYWNVS